MFKKNLSGILGFSSHVQVRVNALLCFGELVQTLDKHAVLEILQTIQRCTAVDRSAPTLMCTLGVANSILKQVLTIYKPTSCLQGYCCRRFLCGTLTNLPSDKLILFSMESNLLRSMFFLYSHLFLQPNN